MSRPRGGEPTPQPERLTTVKFPLRLVVLIITLAVVATSCAAATSGGDTEPPEPPLPTGPPEPPPESSTTTVPPELAAACGPVPFEWPSIDLEAFEPLEEDVNAFVDEEAQFEFEAAFGQGESIRWSVVERTDTALLLFAQSPPASTGEPQYGYAEFEVGGDGWRAVGWGGCHIEITTTGFGVATFELDPANPPDPGATSLPVLATERTCAGGQAPVGREVLPIVVETADAVEITVLVQDPLGDQSCPSNPAFPLIVELSAPLGERQIWDAALRPVESRR